MHKVCQRCLATLEAHDVELAGLNWAQSDSHDAQRHTGISTAQNFRKPNELKLVLREKSLALSATRRTSACSMSSVRFKPHLMLYNALGNKLPHDVPMMYRRSTAKTFVHRDVVAVGHGRASKFNTGAANESTDFSLGARRVARTLP